MYVLQSIAQFELAMGYSNSLNFILSTAIMICGQFDQIFCSIKNMKYTALFLKGGQEKKLR